MTGLGGITGTKKRKLFVITYRASQKSNRWFYYVNFEYAEHFLYADNKSQAKKDGMKQIQLERPDENIKFLRIEQR
jgi:hypothetical protein